MDKEFEISMIITVTNETEDTIADKFIKWVTDNNWLAAGCIREYNEDEEEDGWEYSEN